MLQVRDVSIEVGHRVLVEGASFSLRAGDKVGLVGPNGAGKTTLVKTIAGLREPHAGMIVRPDGLDYLDQNAGLPEVVAQTGLHRVLSGRDMATRAEELEGQRLRIEATAGAERDRVIARFATLEEQFARDGGYKAEADAKSLASALGIGVDELARPVGTLSGGQRRRIELARILYAEAPYLLLDEPTNHLDTDAKEWLLDFFAAYRGGLLVISHDLPLLDAAITKVLDLEPATRTVTEYRGNYSHFLAERERERERRARERATVMRKIAAMRATADRFRVSATKTQVATNMDRRIAVLESGVGPQAARRRAVSVTFPKPEPSGRTPLEACGIAKSYGGTEVFARVSFAVERGERLLLIGLNGAGKTTCLRILAGVEHPDAGEVLLGLRASLGYYAQEHDTLRPGETCLDHMRRAARMDDAALRGILGAFLLEGEQAFQDVATLSGGEKTKLALATLVAGRHNVLLLDEPTNNLDPQARDALLEMLASYSGTIILVSHDTEFVAALAPDRYVVMPEGTIDYWSEDILELVALA